ncbi:MAG TPA: PHP domain-containing protein [Armatimonadetes bacterium]|nr:PHP domain-containing protein [Armatimonadota bacterium]
MNGVDLHTHTTASDGSLSPRELVGKAKALGLAAVAITDHDTLAGLAEGTAAGGEEGIEVVPGVEISLAFPAGPLHLLGYFIAPDHPGLEARLREIQQARKERIPRLVAKLRELGLPLTLADVEREARGEVMGRPHVALALVRRGLVDSVATAFARYLNRRAPAYVPRPKMPPAEALALIQAAGGLAVLAHPGQASLPPFALEIQVAGMRAQGLKGLEVYYPEHTPAQTSFYLRLAEKYGLLITGGSDFHGSAKPHLRLGEVVDGRPVPYELLAKLRSR